MSGLANFLTSTPVSDIQGVMPIANPLPKLGYIRIDSAYDKSPLLGENVRNLPRFDEVHINTVITLLLF